MTDLRLVDLDRVLTELRRWEVSGILQRQPGGPSGFLKRLYERDPSVLIEGEPLRRLGPHGLSAEEFQRQLGVCPGCRKNETVRNVRSDLFVCADVDPQWISGTSAKGCGAQWRGARLGSPS